VATTTLREWWVEQGEAPPCCRRPHTPAGPWIPVSAGEKKAEEIARERRGFFIVFHRVAYGRVGTSKEGSMTTIQEIEASYGEKAAGTVEGWYETQDEIDREIEPVEGPHAGLFTAQQRAGAARTQMGERAGEG
jgi:hypothetical protein